MLAQIKPKSSTSSRMSLLERRKMKSLPLKAIAPRKNPIELLKNGTYDIRSSEILISGDPVDDEADTIDSITAFLESEDVRPVSLNQYLKDSLDFQLKQATPILSTPSCKKAGETAGLETPDLKTSTATPFGLRLKTITQKFFAPPITN